MVTRKRLCFWDGGLALNIWSPFCFFGFFATALSPWAGSWYYPQGHLLKADESQELSGAFMPMELESISPSSPLSGRKTLDFTPGMDEISSLPNPSLSIWSPQWEFLDCSIEMPRTKKEFYCDPPSVRLHPFSMSKINTALLLGESALLNGNKFELPKAKE